MANRLFEDSTEREAMQHDVIAAMLTLPDEEWLVLYHLYYNRLTLTETAQVLGVSRERATRLQAHALRCLRHPDISRTLKCYL